MLQQYAEIVIDWWQLAAIETAHMGTAERTALINQQGQQSNAKHQASKRD